MNPDGLCVQTIARTLSVEAGYPLEEGDVLPAAMVQIAMAVMFDLAKAGVRVVEPGDIIGEPVTDTEAGIVTLLLAVE